MTFHAATATPPPATPLSDLLPPLATLLAAAVGVLLLCALGYTAACAASPFARCRRCEGVGKTIKPNGRVKRWCRHCKGTGLRLRTGRRAYNYLRRLRRQGTRPTRVRTTPPRPFGK
ncbi:hypothetical protein AB0B45_22250 [Nonomuraea sp. NPDC049152]|uniref:hypothetical protein n=1 Tax=Nonomuraea sp. NPDC049152 TaxID=3154350 RepID=UPI0033D4D47E